MTRLTRIVIRSSQHILNRKNNVVHLVIYCQQETLYLKSSIFVDVVFYIYTSRISTYFMRIYRGLLMYMKCRKWRRRYCGA